MERGHFWKKLFKFGKKLGEHIAFSPPNFDAVANATVQCLRKETSDWGFKKMWIMGFFCFLWNLKFLWKPRSVSCISKIIRFPNIRKPFRVSICGLLQKTKNSHKKPLKLSVCYYQLCCCETIYYLHKNITCTMMAQSAQIYFRRDTSCFKYVWWPGTISPNNLGSLCSMLARDFICNLRDNNEQGSTVTWTETK